MAGPKQSVFRLLNFYRDELGASHPALTRRIGMRLHETQTLADQTSFTTNQVGFQLDASLGMISVEQNLIAKIFTIAAGFLLPPTLISSIYGMNFQHMPELGWVFGYPMAIGMMIAAAAGTFIYFKKKTGYNGPKVTFAQMSYTDNRRYSADFQ